MQKQLKTIKHYLIAFSPSVIWAIVIFILSHQRVLPSLTISIYDFVLKKIAHMFVYAVLFYLLYQGMKKVDQKTSPVRLSLIAILLCFLYAISDEIHQSLIPGRYATIRDIIYDLIGASTVMLKKLKYL